MATFSVQKKPNGRLLFSNVQAVRGRYTAQRIARQSRGNKPVTGGCANHWIVAGMVSLFQGCLFCGVTHGEWPWISPETRKETKKIANDSRGFLPTLGIFELHRHAPGVLRQLSTVGTLSDENVPFEDRLVVVDFAYSPPCITVETANSLLCSTSPLHVFGQDPVIEEILDMARRTDGEHYPITVIARWGRGRDIHVPFLLHRRFLEDVEGRICDAGEVPVTSQLTRLPAKDAQGKSLPFVLDQIDAVIVEARNNFRPQTASDELATTSPDTIYHYVEQKVANLTRETWTELLYTSKHESPNPNLIKKVCLYNVHRCPLYLWTQIPVSGQRLGRGGDLEGRVNDKSFSFYNSCARISNFCWCRPSFNRNSRSLHCLGFRCHGSTKYMYITTTDSESNIVSLSARFVALFFASRVVLYLLLEKANPLSCNALSELRNKKLTHEEKQPIQDQITDLRKLRSAYVYICTAFQRTNNCRISQRKWYD